MIEFWLIEVVPVRDASDMPIGAAVSAAMKMFLIVLPVIVALFAVEKVIPMRPREFASVLSPSRLPEITALSFGPPAVPTI